ncbi:MAG: hypothetical protein ONB30_02265 [candidate division KSB1 bacterium]|nr:hypothetical protein [candidate division KSB1 bacterium]
MLRYERSFPGVSKGRTYGVRGGTVLSSPGRHPSPTLMLVADYVDGTWDGVVNAWCQSTGYSSLCLVSCKREATAFLVVAKHEHQVIDGLKDLQHERMPVVWIDDYAGTVRAYASVQELLQELNTHRTPGTGKPTRS